jgi:PAS domain-containing protein
MQALQRSLSPQDETFSRSLVRLGGIFVALQSVVLAVAYWLEGAPDWPWRLLANAIACSIGMAAWALERRGAGLVPPMCWSGVCGGDRAGGPGHRRARSHNQLGLPIILLFCGWVLGQQPALWLLAASLGAIMAFKLAQLWGVMGGLVMTWTSVIYTCGMLVLTVVATLLARQHFMSRAAIAEAAQEQLRASEHELRKLSLAVEQCPASIVITDMQTHVVYANQAFLQRSGYALQEVLGRPRVSVHHGHG